MDNFMLKKWTLCLGVILYSSSWAHMFQGQVSILSLDDFKNNKSKYLYELKVDNINYELIIPKALLSKIPLQTGDLITVEGDLMAHQQGGQAAVLVDSMEVNQHYTMASPNKDLITKHKILTLLLNFTDLKTTDTVSTQLIDSQLYISKTSVKNNYYISSIHQFQFVRTPDATGNPGIYPITLNFPAGAGCDFLTWADGAIAAATAQGINVNAYEHLLYLLPQNVHCPWGGIAYIGCAGTCESWVVAYGGANISGLMAHELGHNIGLDHSSTHLNNAGNVSEYGDQSDFMSSGFNRQLNAPHRDQLHWYDAFPHRMITVTANGQYTLKSIDLINNVLQVLKVKKKDNTGTYYISYRTNTVPFGMVNPYKAKIQIHLALPGNMHSYLITTLGQGEVFSDNANGVNVTALNTNINSSGIVNVTLR